MKKTNTLIFILLATMFVATRFIEPFSFSWLMKIFPMLYLIRITLTKSNNSSEKVFLVGLLFSTLGDFFLEYDTINLFIFGLISFLLAHTFYIISFAPLSRLKIKTRLPIIVFYVIFGLTIFVFLSKGLGELFIPVLIYMTVLLLMAVSTLVSYKSNNWLIIGGVSFVISDSLLGMNKFYLPIPYAEILIMISYYFAQYALVNSVLHYRIFQSNGKI